MPLKLTSIFKLRTITIICSYLLLCSCFVGFSQNETSIKASKKDSIIDKKKSSVTFNGADGPYLIKDTLFRITRENQFLKELRLKDDSLLVEVDNKDKDRFYFNLNNNQHLVPKSNYKAAHKMIVISDIEGNYNAFASFLYSNKVIDKNHDWTYNDGKLILVGDFVDRGINVTQVLWLIYKLEQQAKTCGGQVHFVLGNHEVLNFQGQHRYNRLKYIKAAQKISGFKDKSKATAYMYSDVSELGKWLATKNVIEKIGDYIFVHAGLSPEILDYKLSLNEINNNARALFHINHSENNIETTETDISRFIYGSKGPFWYRGLVIKHYKYPVITQEKLDKVLNFYSAKKVVIGHTVVNTISSTYNGNVIRIDVLHGKTKFSGRTKGLLIENDKEYIVNDLGEKQPL